VQSSMDKTVLAETARRGVPVTVLAPHLDDAALSCGSLMLYAAKFTSVTVATFFTEAGLPPYTLSARRFFHQMGAQCPQTLFQQRRLEDRAALETIDVKCVHVGLTDALFRRRPYRKQSLCTTLIPELGHIYPVYRKHVVSGRIAGDDADTLRDASEALQRLAGPREGILLAPLGIGGHVDHVLVRTVAEQSGKSVVYYSDFPYNQRAAGSGFVQDKGLIEMRWAKPSEAKIKLIRAYGTQVDALFGGGSIPLAPEVYFSSPRDIQRSFAGRNDYMA
jgi:LmbE family N-acetylglucosaminyl deacetylase